MSKSPSSLARLFAELKRRKVFRADPRFDALLARQAAWEAEQARLAEAEGPWVP